MCMVLDEAKTSLIRIRAAETLLKAGWTQAAVARAFGVTQRTVENWVARMRPRETPSD